MMKKNYLHAVFILTATIFSASLQAQITSGLVSNFGIEGDLYSGEDATGTFPPANTHDWFYRQQAANSGIGVIDTTNANAIRNANAAGSNAFFSKGMAFPRYSLKSGKLMIDARYVRDNMGLSGSVKDSTVFASGAKNGMAPATWSTSPNGSSVSDKTDIIDGYAHLRRDGIVATGSNPDHLYLMLGAATVGTTGSRFVDMELYRSRIAYDKTTGVFSNSGPAASGGHTPWAFNANGTIAQLGDMDIAFDFSGNGIAEIALYIWVAKTTVQTMVPTGFDFVSITEFYGDGQNATFGYAKIKPKSGGSLPVWGKVNANYAVGPVWGTSSKEIGSSNNNYYSLQYSAGQFAEVGIDLTAMGIDVGFNANNDPCTPPYTRLMIKTRTSASFTSALSDFTGPVEFMDGPQVPASIETPERFKCNVSVLQLKPEIITAGAIYNWSTSNGNITSSTSNAIIQIDQPGKYYLTTQASPGCMSLIDSVVVVADKFKPVATASRTGAVSINTTAMIFGGDEMASNYSTPFGGSAGLTWSWTGPMGYTSSLQNNEVTVEGTYRLIITEMRNGCQDMAYVVVPSGAPLPVSLVDFSGTYVNGNALLKWSTLLEINTDRFDVERSVDGVRFTKIASVKATGNSNNKLDYSCTDNKLNKGSNFYRLKIMNSDGSFAYSKVVNINSNSDAIDMFLVYPNPFGNTLQVRAESGRNEKVMIRIVSSEGKTVKMQGAVLQQGVNNIIIDNIASLQRGIYYFELITSEKTSRTKIIKQ